MPIDIDRLTEGELLDLHHRITERLRLLQQVRAHTAMMEFSIGDPVEFSPAGRPVRGIITRYNRKTVTVIAEGGRRWNVSPGLLRPAGVIGAHEAPKPPIPVRSVPILRLSHGDGSSGSRGRGATAR